MSEKEKKQCAAMVNGSGQWGAFHRHPCGGKVAHHEDGDDWCAMHSPTIKAQRRTALQAKRDAKWKQKELGWEIDRIGKELIEAVLKWDETGNAKPLQKAIVAYRKLADTGAARRAATEEPPRGDS